MPVQKLFVPWGARYPLDSDWPDTVREEIGDEVERMPELSRDNLAHLACRLNQVIDILNGRVCAEEEGSD